MRSRFVLAMCLLAVGCGRTEQIEHYTVAKPHVLDKLTGGSGAAKPAMAAESPTKPGRTLAAIVPLSDRGWFFKLTGPDAPVAAQQEKFDEFLRSVRFAEGAKRPTWKLPEGWREEPGSGMRFATVKIDSDSVGSKSEPLELTVIALPRGGDTAERDFDENEYLLSNVNRWRSQLKLPPIKLADLEPQTQRVTLGEGVTATIVDLAGTLSPESAAMGRAPFAGRMGAMPEGHPPLSLPRESEKKQ
ncbi:MAG TPA: hypothetical protein VHZ24_18755 [Pirellulales bacterium]|nr:hypothetical protein [Pirellulales bacterium]